jgi:hypothetical protein
MQNSVQVERIINEIKILDYYAKLEILEKLVRLLKEPAKQSKKKSSLLQLEGLGKEIWNEQTRRSRETNRDNHRGK